MEEPVVVKSMRVEDLDDVGRMAAALVRYHNDVDPKRFLLVEGVERGYKRYFESQLADTATVLLVATRGEQRVGYAYARVEPRDWNALLDAHGALHDIYVEAGARRGGVATALLDEVRSRLRAAGAPRMVLMTAVQNEAAQRLFERHGFRRTMLEMTEELP
ncbi:MAG TPA: GNAT family N-acetyltransferase [Polyangiaceae bacterium]|jgi:ribosomal protein S18 acetylase RimI-like enzyme|nr:GNAT family N-acetyltransferase [Polyangiaceae bacterium]